MHAIVLCLTQVYSDRMWFIQILIDFRPTNHDRRIISLVVLKKGTASKQPCSPGEYITCMYRVPDSQPSGRTSVPALRDYIWRDVPDVSRR